MAILDYVADQQLHLGYNNYTDEMQKKIKKMLLKLDTDIGAMWGTRMEVVIEWQRCEECDYWFRPTYYSWGDTHETTFMCTFPIEGGVQPFYKGTSNPEPGSIKSSTQITDADQAACLLLTLAMAEGYLS